MEKSVLLHAPVEKIREVTTQQFYALKKMCRAKEDLVQDLDSKTVAMLNLCQENPMLVSIVCGFVPKDKYSAQTALLMGKEFFEASYGFPRREKFLRTLYKRKRFSKDVKTLGLCQAKWCSSQNQIKHAKLKGKREGKFEDDLESLLDNRIGVCTAARWLSVRHKSTFDTSRRRYIIANRNHQCRAPKEVAVIKTGKQRKCDAEEYATIKNNCVLGVFCRAIDACLKEVTVEEISLAIAIVAVVCSELDVQSKVARFDYWFTAIEKLVAQKTPYAARMSLLTA